MTDWIEDEEHKSWMDEIEWHFHTLRDCKDDCRYCEIERKMMIYKGEINE